MQNKQNYNNKTVQITYLQHKCNYSVKSAPVVCIFSSQEAEIDKNDTIKDYSASFLRSI